MSYKRIASTLIALLLLTPCCFTYAITPETKYSEWALSEIEKAEKLILMIPDHTSDLTSDITREDLAAILVELFERITEKPIENLQSTVSDTNNIAVLKACSIGIMEPMSETQFFPQSTISRGEAFVCYYKLIQAVFPDRAAIPTLFNFIDLNDFEQNYDQRVHVK